MAVRAMPPESLRVLLIEDNPGFARYVTESLGQSRELSAEVVWTPELLAGVELARTQPFDVVLVDLGVRDGAGLGNVPLLRAVAPNSPVIVGGETDDDILALEAVHAGAQDYLVKGQLTPAWIERAIRYALERHRMDAALHQAEEKYHHLFDHLVEGIFQTTPEGRYLLANAALARIYGYATPEELMDSVQENISRKIYVQPGRRAEFVRLMQEFDTITGFESQAYRHDGTVIWISENCRAIRDAAGRLLYYEGTVEDITQRRQAEENLSKSEALYHSLVETLPQNIFRKNQSGKFTFANQQFCKTLGRTLQEIVGKTDFDFFPQELAEKYQKDDRKVLDTGKPYDTVEEHRPPGGDKMYVQVVKTPIYDAEGKALGLQGIFWDITQQRLAEEKIRRVNTQLTLSRKELRQKNQQMEDDLKMAREIQLTMLPQQYPSFPRPGKRSESAFEFTHRYYPTGSVGGDFFTVSALSEREAAVFICDVAGHGVRSSLVTAMVRALVEELKPLATNPGAFLTKLNSDLHAILRHAGTPMLTTAFYLVADWETGKMRYANAGHPKPLHLMRKPGQAVFLGNAAGRSQPALGLFEDASYQTTEQRLEAGDVVMLFTDGLYEVHDTTEELYTQAMLQKNVQARMQLPVGEMFDAVLGEVRAFSASGFSDDVCLVGLEYRGGPNA
jgi:sigma-B regulation protein RsbU (phosphoserine phosphatase)